MTPTQREILLVDDDEMTHYFVREILQILLTPDIAILTAEDGEEAIAILKKDRTSGRNSIKWLLTDWQMPRLNGTGLLRQIQESPKLTTLKTIIWTGGVLSYLKNELKELKITNTAAYTKTSEQFKIETMLRQDFPRLFVPDTHDSDAITTPHS